jgi:hypothetical protein
MKLAQSLNRTVLVAMPAFFGDNDARPCTLVDVDTTGLWLACDELRDRLGPAQEISAAWTARVTGFFPFTQILYVVDPAQFAVLASGGERPLPPPAEPPAPVYGNREHVRREGRPKQKSAKGRR